MKTNTILAHLLLASGLLFVGACSKKEAAKDVPAAKTATASGSAAPVPPPPGGDPVQGDPAKADPAAAGTDPAKADPAQGDSAKGDVAATKPLLEVAKEQGNLTTFLKAVEVAGLTETLAAPGPITIFAPTDEAFAKVPAKDLEALLADKTKLVETLKFHIVEGAVLAKDLTAPRKSLQGGELTVDTASGVKIGGAGVAKADLAATNGVIHEIDTVLAPAAPTKAASN
jgi:uncharacterized surface protein with fasciclin (FAS1) repeats